MKLPFLSMLMDTLDGLDGLSGILKRIWFFLSLPFVALFSGLYAGSSKAGRIFAQIPFRSLVGTSGIVFGTAIAGVGLRRRRYKAKKFETCIDFPIRADVFACKSSALDQNLTF